ncbi:uncharacterized protein FIBRA_01318 [Fibroporia radiculosa]|uniref:Uncharacterized protein n=1 Tax=Fibroporia radiculosa TaxID=599839 RepID=J4HT45_9APHY|nr:uncharacterized protein FIBRA_01318 [Fibroporia radiculosa]CCL99302.1 predicted protein [Fibroporia radiculosa]
MSRSSKSLTLSRIEDLTLGSFAFVPTSETVDHLVRYLSTWSGSDKFFMIIQHTLKLLVPFLHFRARMQHRAGLRKEPISSAAESLVKFSNIISDARMFFRIWGLLPIIQWLTSIERKQPPTRRILTIERLQGWSMLAYYPLEHLYYLVAHSIVPSKLSAVSLLSLLPSLGSKPGDKSITLDAKSLGMWSCRFWSLYVALQFAHLLEDRKLLKTRERTVSKTKSVVAESEKEELKKRWDSFWSEVIVNLGNLPTAIHWSLERGLFASDIWLDAFGLVAGLASWRSGWKATALPIVPPASEAPDLSSTEPSAHSSMTLDPDIVAPPLNDSVTGY